MHSSMFETALRDIVTALVVLAVSPPLAAAQQMQADCGETLKAYFSDTSLAERRLDNPSRLRFKRGGVEYVCTCSVNSRPPVCQKSGSSGPGRLGGVDMSRFNPGQQVALMATQSVLQGLLNGIFNQPAKGPSNEDALRAQQEALRQQEEDRQEALAGWNSFQEEEAARVEAEKRAARQHGAEILGKTGASAGQGVGFEPVAGKGLEVGAAGAGAPKDQPAAGGRPATVSAAEQARCAAFFSNQALDLQKKGLSNDARSMSLQAQKAMTGESTDVPCPPGPVVVAPPTNLGAAGSSSQGFDINAVLEEYNVKVQELLEISTKLAGVRKQKIDAALDVRHLESRVMDLKSQSARATKPEDKRQADDLVQEALALLGASEARLKTAEENENACLSDARKAESQVKELDAKIKKGSEAK